MQFTFVFFLASTIITVLGASSVSQCFDDLQDIQERVKALNSGIENFDRTNLLEAWVGDGSIWLCTQNLSL